ncbi:MAG: hypothetical protein Tsb0014_27500 [Pleurocapsa sp.]
MQNKLNSASIPPKQKFSNIFRLLAQIGYWIHFILGATSGVILGLIIFSRKLGEPANNAAIKISIVFAVASLITLGLLNWITGE